MIFDRISNLPLYASVLPGMKQALRFVRENDLNALPDGRHELSGGVFANMMTYLPGCPERFEAHKKYVDLQIVVQGEEGMEGLPLSCAGDAVSCDGGDARFYARREPMTKAVVRENEFALFFPGDVHRPSIRTENTKGAVRKMVIKIPTEQYAKEAHLLWLMDKIALPENARQAVTETLAKIPEETLAALSEAFFAGEKIQDRLEASAEVSGVPGQLYALTLYLLFSCVTLEKYLDKNISPEVFCESMSDFTIWEKVCEADTGRVGLLQTDWLAQTLRLKLFRLGRFQYEIVTMKSRFAAADGIAVPEGAPVVNMHIPEGEPITREKRIASYKKAFAFFKDIVPLVEGNLVYTCSSWLFYPAHREFLQKGSNIVSFMDDFRMLEAYEKMNDLHDMWRIFGFPADYSDLSKLPESTGMQRAYKKHLLERPATGGAYGFFLFDGETFRK